MKRNRTIATFTLRIVLGVIFFMQGMGKVFSWGVDNIFNSEMFLGTFKDTLPQFIIQFTAYYTSYVELFAGFLVIIGLKRDYALYALASVLIIVTFGHGLDKPVWDLSHVMYRLILLATLLSLPRQWDRWSLDFLLNMAVKARVALCRSL